MNNTNNFKVLCLKDDDCEGLKYFYKGDILEFKNGKCFWRNYNYSNLYENYQDFINTNCLWDDSYFKLINKEENNNYTNSVNLNMSRINKLTQLDNKSLLERTLKLSEECGEVAEATLSYLKTNGSQYKEKGFDDVLEENLDVIMIAISNICQLYNYETDSKFIQDLFDTKLQKWYNKCCKDNDK